MALNPHPAAVAANAGLDAIAALLNTGWIRIYDGAQPANAGTAITTQNILAELRFGATAFPASSGGVATANAITGDSSANNTGTAAWFRLFKSDGTTAILDGSVGLSAADMILTTLSIVAGVSVGLVSLTISIPL